ncbi:MAG: divergent polysaccharide deacetylase family protein [Pseudomonadota bacterium]
MTNGTLAPHPKKTCLEAVARGLGLVCVALFSGVLIGLSIGALAEPAGRHSPGPSLALPADPSAQAQLVVAEPKPDPHGAPLAAGTTMPAWERYAAATPAADGRPLVAIVIDDMGMDRKRSTRAMALPAPLTLAFLPYAHDLDRQTAAARATGHELLLHVPMEPQGTENPGPGALIVALGPAEIRRRLAADLALIPGAVGINNHMGSKFTREVGAMRPVIEELQARGLLFLDSRTTSSSVGAELARRAGLGVAERDVFLDNQPSPEAVAARLAEVEALARRRGYALAIGHPHDGTLDALEPWLRAAAARGLAVVPLSAVVRHRLRRDAPAHTG